MNFRSVRFKNIEHKESADGKTATFEGYGNTFGRVDHYDDVVVPGAFSKTLSDIKQSTQKLVMLWQHFYDCPIGVFVEMVEDKYGLHVKGEINLECAQGREAYSLLRQGAIKAMSIGYQSVKDEIKEGIRYLKEVKLWEISLVTFPADESALITSVKSKFSQKEIDKCIELLLSLKGEPGEAHSQIDPSDGQSIVDEMKKINKELVDAN